MARRARDPASRRSGAVASPVGDPPPDSARAANVVANVGADAAGAVTPKDSRAQPAAPPIAWRRNLYAIAAAQTLAIVGFSLRVPFLPFYVEDLGATTVGEQALWTGLINAGGAGVMAIAAPVWGVVADRRGRKPMLLRAALAGALTVTLMSLATSPWQLLALRFVEGALTGTVTAATALVAAGTPRERMGYGLGMVQTAVFAGASLGPLVGGLLADQIGYRPTFVAAGAMLAASGLIVLFLVQERFTPPAPTVAAGTGRLAALRATGRSTAALVLGRTMLILIVTLLVVRLAAMAVQPIMPLFVEELAPDVEDTSSLAGLILGVLGLTSAIAAVYFGRLGDRIGHRRILLGCAAGGGLLYLPMAAAQSPWHLLVLQALFGVAAGGLVPSANALIARHTPAERRGAVFGAAAAAASLGAFVGPLAGAGLAAALGFRATFVATAIVLLAVAAAIATSMRQPAAGARPGGS